jgi:catechol 2,3-dioxygenase-like lactoylglutathione lyase family enzyme
VSAVPDMKLEVIVIPVSDVDRSRDFYVGLGWRLDETPPGVVQLTPPGSGCSVQFGANLTTAEPGSAQHNYLVVDDLEATRDRMVAAGVEMGEIWHIGPEGPVPGLDPERRSYFSRAELSDPDGNTWWFQEITTRLPGRVDADAGTTYASIADLASALRRAEAAHGEHERRTGQRDEDWPSWYAEYMIKEQSGAELPT